MDIDFSSVVAKTIGNQTEEYCKIIACVFTLIPFEL